MTLSPADFLEPLRDFFELDSVGAIIIDPEGVPQFINARAVHILGLDRAATREQLRTIKHPQWKEMLDLLPVASPLGPLEMTFNTRKSPITALVRCRSIPSAHILAGHSLITLLDVTRERQIDHDLRDNLRYTAELTDTAIAQSVELKHQAEQLEKRVRQRTSELHSANVDAIYMLAVACEAKDHDTGQHVRRIQQFTERLARKLGMSDERSQDLGAFALLHDVGKLHIPDAILGKPGTLTAEERTIMREHTIHGHRIIVESHFLHVARQIARSHHENWDGTGYPDGLTRDNIPLPARMVHLVDVYDALTSPRVYKKSWTHEKAMEELQRQQNIMFDPELVEAFVAVMAEQSKEKAPA